MNEKSEINENKEEVDEDSSLTKPSTKKIKRSNTTIMKPKIAKNTLVVKLLPEKIIDDEQVFNNNFFFEIIH